VVQRDGVNRQNRLFLHWILFFFSSSIFVEDIPRFTLAGVFAVSLVDSLIGERSPVISSAARRRQLPEQVISSLDSDGPLQVSIDVFMKDTPRFTLDGESAVLLVDSLIKE